MQRVPIGDVVPNESNPRTIKGKAMAKLVMSLKDFPEMAEARPLILNKDMVILGGNMRFKAMQTAGWETVPVQIVDWSTERQREFIIKDNIASGDWDTAALAAQYEQDELEEWGLEGVKMREDENIYTDKVAAPVYEAKGDEPDISELVDTTTRDKLFEDIDKSGAGPELAAFLKSAAERHTKFNFENIAEFYCHQTPEIKKLMEDSALVIIDFDAAIENGFVVLSDGFALEGEDEADDE